MAYGSFIQRDLSFAIARGVTASDAGADWCITV
jgi:hypothetical protein